MSTGHLTPETIGGIIDGELTPAEGTAAQAHLQGCNACALEVISAQQLKLATRQTAQRFTPSPETLARLEAAARQHPAKPAKATSWHMAAWGSLAAVLLIGILLAGTWQLRRSTALSAEILDQHLAALADASSPQVLSSDKHTVKPWFQGKLPFSFNLPEQNALAPDSALVGADFTYVEGRPAALLLFTIHKHHVSVFVTQASPLQNLVLSNSRSGFQIAHANAAGLDLVGVSDVSRSELDALMGALMKAQ
ncbi:MAG: zf-HC2 domain-containing protein [Terracidiphilus sp.]